MKKLLGIVVLGLIYCNICSSQIIELTKCYVNSMDDRKNPSNNWNYNDEMWNENSYKNFMERYGFTISSITVNTETANLSLIDGTEENLNKLNYSITDYYDGIVLFEENKFPTDPTSPVESYKQTKINLNLKTGKMKKYHKGSLKIFDNANDPPRVELISDYTYRMICEVNKSTGTDSGSSGTAFFVSNKGHLLTNNHVVEGCSISKITYNNKDYDTRLLATDKTLDLALLKVNLKNKSYIDFAGDEAKKMQKVYVGGYPLGKGLSDDLKISSGIVSSLKGFEDNSNEIQIDAAINPGNSGGPIINEDGELVAIAVSGLAKDQTEGINFGIKASAAERFLKSNKLKANKSIFSSSKNNEQLLKILEEATVYTYCN